MLRTDGDNRDPAVQIPPCKLQFSPARRKHGVYSCSHVHAAADISFMHFYALRDTTVRCGRKVPFIAGTSNIGVH